MAGSPLMGPGGRLVRAGGGHTGGPVGHQGQPGLTRSTFPGPATHPPRRARAHATRFEDGVAITGIGRSGDGYDAVLGARAAALDACRAAVKDAGLSQEDIGAICAGAATADLLHVVPDGDLTAERPLELYPARYLPRNTPGPTGGVVDAMKSVASGEHRHVLCLAVFTAADSPHTGLTSPEESAARARCFAATRDAHMTIRASRYLARHQLGREALGWIAVSARRHAATNPDALCRSPLAIESYLSASARSSPLGPLDRAVPCDGAVALIVSARADALDLQRSPVWVDGVGSSSPRRSARAGGLGRAGGATLPSARMWERASMSRDDVDFVSLDDSSSFNALTWLEALGFCAPGRAAEFVRGGITIGPDGVLPMNSDGGQLAAGRDQGYGALYETVLQLRGQAEARQIPSVRVAAYSSGTPDRGCAMLLSSESRNDRRRPLGW